MSSFSSEQIIDNGCAYTINGDVYFSVDKFPSYGRLSGRRLDDNQAGKRVAVDARKQNPADFALWKVREFFFFFWSSVKMLCMFSTSEIHYYGLVIL